MAKTHDKKNNLAEDKAAQLATENHENPFRSGQSFQVLFFHSREPIKVHIDHVLPSYYDDVTLIIYRFFGKHKRWWHEQMCTSQEMEQYKLNAKKINEK